ncbi:MAG: hypothetical protein ABSF61_12140 [Anaerolineales bacterium]|jgi:hypothetical protein
MRRLGAWTNAHPRLTAWAVIGAVLDGVVAFDSRSLHLGLSRVGLLLLATTFAAGVAVWVVEWN